MSFLKCPKKRYVSVLLGLLTLAAIWVAPSAANSILFEDDFETCNYQKYSDVAHNQINRTIRHSGNCSSRIGGDTVRFGKLVASLSSSQAEVWFTAWVFFPTDFQLPAPGGGIHLWRLLGGNYGTGGVMLDFIVTTQGNVQLAHFPGNSGGKDVSKWTGFNPITGDRKARWQCWEVHSRLNQPGQNDGLVEFYAEGTFVDSISGSFRGNSTAPYTVVDVQSNIGGNEALWPVTNWWYIDNVVVSTDRVGCLPAVPDTTPPGSPTGVRINSQ